MTEIAPTSRVQIVDVPVAAPGHCVLCRSANTEDRQYVDFNWSVDWYGAVYFCTYCFAEIANAIGFATPENLTESHKENDRLMTENLKLLALTGTQRRIINEFAGNCTCGIAGADSDSVDDSPGAGNFGPAEDNSVDASDESDADESGGLEGSDGIHDAPAGKPARKSAAK